MFNYECLDKIMSSFPIFQWCPQKTSFITNYHEVRKSRTNIKKISQQTNFTFINPFFFFFLKFLLHGPNSPPLILVQWTTGSAKGLQDEMLVGFCSAEYTWAILTVLRAFRATSSDAQRHLGLHLENISYGDAPDICFNFWLQQVNSKVKDI